MKVVAVFIVAFGFMMMTMTEAPAKMMASKVSGEVTAVDAAAKTVTVKTKDKDVTMMVTDKTSIAQGKEKKTLADIQAGTKVTAKYVTEGDKMTAKSINIAAPKK